MFSREQYFDSSGLFITVVYSGPILFNCFILTVSVLKKSSTVRTLNVVKLMGK